MLRSARAPSPALALILVLLLLALPIATGSDASAGARDATLKLDVRAPRGKTKAGEIATLRIQLKNRVDAPRDIAVQVFSDLAPDEPFTTATYSFGAGEKRIERVPFSVPAEFIGERLRVFARAGELQDGVKVKVRMGRLSEEQWERARDLYRAKCAACHGRTGADVRGDSSTRWIQAMRGGPGSMPTYSTSNADILLMRAYTRRPRRP